MLKLNFVPQVFPLVAHKALLSPKDIANCRQVCRMWKTGVDDALPALGSKDLLPNFRVFELEFEKLLIKHWDRRHESINPALSRTLLLTKLVVDGPFECGTGLWRILVEAFLIPYGKSIQILSMKYRVPYIQVMNSLGIWL